MAAAPTVAMSQGEHTNNNGGGSSIPSSSSLFNSDETKFMNDSFSSAESFDPFTVGAPGFKVPNVLPANIGGIGSAPGMTSRQNDENSAGGSSHDQNLASLNDAGLNANSLGTITGRRGYGQDKAWQMQQLEALQAERFRYMTSKQDPSSQSSLQSQHMHRHSLAGPSVLPDTSMIGHSLYQDNTSGWGPYNPALQQQHQQQNNNSIPDHYSSNFANSNMNQSMHPNQSGDLSALGAHFPSSHQFPGSGNHFQQHNNRPASFPYFTSQNQIANQMRDQFGQNNSGSFQGAVGGMDQEMNVAGEQNRNKKGVQKVRQNQSQQQQSNQTMEAEVSYTFTPAPRPPMPLLDVEKVEQSNIIPTELKEEFFSNSLKRFQPHLIELRKEQLRRKAQGLSANIRKDRKDAKQAAKGGIEDEDSTNEATMTAAGKKKQTQILLTEAEKKANHIASEQKRRANIRKGYELLCSLVPSLSEGVDGGNGGGGGDDGEDDEDDDDDDDEEENDEDEDEEGGSDNKRRGKKRRAMGGDSSGNNNNNENKTGPRSEAIILMKAVDHIRSKIDEHYFLVKKKQEIQNDLAKRFGANSSCFLD